MFLISFSYEKCDRYIEEYKNGMLQTQPGFTPEETLEVSPKVVYSFFILNS